MLRNVKGNVNVQSTDLLLSAPLLVGPLLFPSRRLERSGFAHMYLISIACPSIRAASARSARPVSTASVAAQPGSFTLWGDQPWDFFGRNDAKAETPVLWPPHEKS